MQKSAHWSIFYYCLPRTIPFCKDLSHSVNLSQPSWIHCSSALHSANPSLQILVSGKSTHFSKDFQYQSYLEKSFHLSQSLKAQKPYLFFFVSNFHNVSLMSLLQRKFASFSNHLFAMIRIRSNHWSHLLTSFGFLNFSVSTCFSLHVSDFRYKVVPKPANFIYSAQKFDLSQADSKVLYQLEAETYIDHSCTRRLWFSV